MLRSIALILAIPSVALAQSSNSSATANPLIPSGISGPCSTFLNSLNSDSSLTSCLNTLTTATSSFGPGRNDTITKATVSSTLTTLCADSVTSTCPESLIRIKITEFYSACTAELTTSKNRDVIRLYDTIYTILPMRTSICSKDESGNWCVLASPKAGTKETSPITVPQILAALYSTSTSGASLRRRGPQSPIVPNMATFRDNNLPFLYHKPDLEASSLCTTCVRLILTAYMAFESNVAYAPGLSNSQLLDTQPSLYDAVKKKCPANFLSGAVQAAAGLGGGVLSSAAVTTINAEQKTAIALVMGTAMLAIAPLF